jgi:glycosyltransferase involved in cell wall biosynthesis
LPEAVGDAAELVNPENVFDIAKGLRRVLVDDDHRALLRERGARRVQAFSWDKSAKRVLEIYSEVTKR